MNGVNPRMINITISTMRTTHLMTGCFTPLHLAMRSESINPRYPQIAPVVPQLINSGTNKQLSTYPNVPDIMNTNMARHHPASLSTFLHMNKRTIDTT